MNGSGRPAATGVDMTKRCLLAAHVRGFVITAMAFSLMLAAMAPLSHQVQAVDLLELEYDGGPTVGLVSNPYLCEVQGDSMELAYDDGVMVGLVKAACGYCDEVQAVKFSLPGHMVSGVVTEVSFYYDPAGKATRTLRIDIMQNNDYALENLSYQATGLGWHTVDIPDTAVSGNFVVAIDVAEGRLGYDRWNDNHRGVTGEIEKSLGYPFTNGDIMIRARIQSVIHVGRDQPYKTIQSAVDAAVPGIAIVVHEGTYNENVTVDQSVIIKSLSGPAKTIVQTSPPYSDNNVFRITASCVTLSGFTIKSAIYDDRAGVYVDESSGCLISGNVIEDNNYGIYVSENSTNNILLENESRYNATGIYVDGSENYVSGNKLHGNTAVRGSAVSLSFIASGNRLLFNTITVDPGTDVAVAAGPQVYNENSDELVPAVENWWGTDTGPSNAGGQGPLVGQSILFEPWLTKQPLRVKTAPTAGGDQAMNAREVMNVAVLKQGTGTPMVSSASFGENPFGKFPGTPMGRWVDVLFDSTDGVEQVEIRVHYTADELSALRLKEGSLRLFWWNTEIGKWKACSKTSVNKRDDFVWARLNLKTKPTSNDLGGTMFAVGVPKGGFAWWLIPIIIVIVIIALILLRLFWGLVVRRERYTID
jgi:parallel beta-helix repeat protein